MEFTLPSSPDPSRPFRPPFSSFDEASAIPLQPLSRSIQSKHYATDRNDGLSKALGWFSVGVGILQLLAPRTIARMTGVSERSLLVRALGLREITSGVGILRARNPSGWLWSRVAGDVMDLALLASATRTRDVQYRRMAVAAAAVAGVTVLDLLSSVQHGTNGGAILSEAVDVEKSITINRTANECYRFWRDFQNFPRFMKHLESIQIIDSQRSHWKVKAPGDTSIEWDTQLTADEPGRLLAWHSLVGAEIDNAGIVTFERAAGGRGTIVRLEVQYVPPGRKAAALIATLFGKEPAQQIDGDLRRFKQLIETGEITTTEGQSSGPRSALMRSKGVPQ